jgi:peptidoglycan/LPS O-acetylase OafA/YrhL
MVVADHAGQVLNYGGHADVGWKPALQRGVTPLFQLAIGPPIFFVLSGFCIAASLDSLLARGKSTTEFLAKRLWRTFPPYWTSLALFSATTLLLDALGSTHLYRGDFGLVLQSPRGLDFSQWVGNLSLSENWRSHFWGSGSHPVVEVAWTLGLQEQFYFVCFAVALLSRARFFQSLAWLSVGVVLVRLVAIDIGETERLRGLFFELWYQFAVGLAVYWRLRHARSSRERLAVDLGLVSLAVWTIARADRSGFWAAVAGLAITWGARWDARLADLSLLAPLRSVGRRCFSIYLAHMPALAVGAGCLQRGLPGAEDFLVRLLIVMPTLIALGLGAGWIFHRLVESRFNEPPIWVVQLQPRFGRRSSGPILAASLPRGS